MEKLLDLIIFMIWGPYLLICVLGSIISLAVVAGSNK